MRIILEKLLFKYQRVDYLVRRKATYFYYFLIALSLHFLIFNLINYIFFEVNVITLYFIFSELIVYIFLYFLVFYRKLSYAINFFIIFSLGKSIYLIVEDNTIGIFVYLAFIVLFISTAKLKLYQFIGMLLSVISILTVKLIVSFNFNVSNSFELTVVRDNIEAILYVIIIVVMISIIVFILENEIIKSKKLQDMSKVDFLLMAQKRRESDNIRKQNNINDTSSVLLVRVNKYDEINDKFGYKEGDRIIKIVINLIRKTIRVDDYVLKWNHDSFLVVLHYTSISNAGIVGEKIRNTVEKNKSSKILERITVTVTGATITNGETMQTAITKAEKLHKKIPIKDENYVLLDYT